MQHHVLIHTDFQQTVYSSVPVQQSTQLHFVPGGPRGGLL